MRWNGSQWTQIASPNVGTSDNKLFGITQVPGSSYLFWAVGAYYDTTSSTYKTLTLEGDDRRGSLNFWAVKSSPNTSGVPNCLRSVSALDSNDVWAVGFTDSSCFSEDSEATASGSTGTLLTYKWDGTSWAEETNTEPELTGFNRLFGVSVASSERVWAVGYYTYSSGWASLVLGRDSDGVWRQHCSANPTNEEAPHIWVRMLGVDALSSTVAWASGWYYPTQGGDKPTLVETYDEPDCFR
jgi:hypothetical protein